MQVTETLNEGLKRGYEIVLTADELNAKVDEKLKEAQPEIEMKGFRKGKAPMALLKKQFGQRLMGEAMQESIDDAMKTHFEESGDRPAMQPDVKMTNEDWKEGDDVEVALSYEKLPEVPELDFSGLKLERMVVKAGDADIEDTLNKLAENAQNFDARDEGAAAEDGDQVVFDFVGSVDGEKFDGGSAEDFPLVLGSGQFIPGFEEQLVGAKAGEEKSVNVSFPDDYQAEHLKGKAALFECKIKEVKAPVKAEIDDELAKKYGADDLDGLKARITEQLEGEYSGAARAVVKRALLDELHGMVDFGLPPSLVEAESKQISMQLAQNADAEDGAAEGSPEDEAPKDVEPTQAHIELAERRVRLGLLLADVGQKAQVEITEAEMSQAVMEQARQYPGMERQFFEFVQQNQQMQEQLRAPIFEDKVVDHILGIAAVTEKEVSKADLEKAVEALDDES